MTENSPKNTKQTMSIVKTQDLLSQLSNLESTLSRFSFESLSAEEAASLKLSFKDFKEHLEHKIFPEKEIGSQRAKIFSNRGSKANGQLNRETKFIAHISHEIRTPLNGIIGFANLLREENLNESQARKVEAIQGASQNLMEIINEVLEYAKISSGKEDFIEVDFNFHGLINDVVFLCQTLLLDREIDLQVKIDNRIPGELIGDPSKLSQILLNLLGNSVKFVEKGFIRLEVALAGIKNGKHNIKFTIQDTGIGMSQEQLEGIFQCFKQADKYTSSKYGGTGLGLCIVKELVEKQGGQISVDSKLGEGSAFTFHIEYKKGTSKNVPKKEQSTPDVLGEKKSLNGTKILVFEDNQMNQHLIREQLQNWGCEVYVTSDADKGIGILKTQIIDVVLMDLKMPGLNGFQISNLIRNDKKINQIPIIAISADFTAQDEENRITSGINDFLLKPYTLDELLTKVTKAKNDKDFSEGNKNLLGKEMISKKPVSGVDLNGVLEDCCGEIPVLEELIRLFKQNVYEFIGSVKINLKQENLKEIGLAAHKLKAGLKMLKLEELVQIMVDMQDNCENDEEIKVRSLFQEFLKKYPGYEKEIDEAFIKIKN